MRYWIYLGSPGDSIVIHRSDCGKCNDGKGVHRTLTHGIAPSWRGPYLTRGAAMDAVSTHHSAEAHEHLCMSWL